MRLVALAIMYLTFLDFAHAESPGPSFGNKQFARLLSDRPEMRDVLLDDDVITRWVIRQFNRGPYGERVWWDKREPISDRPAECHPADPIHFASVRITGNDLVTARDKWFLLVFQLHNIPHSQVAVEMSRLVDERRIQRQEFVDIYLLHELDAIRRTLRFLSRYPIPGATRQNAPLYMQYTSSTFPSLPSYLVWLDNSGPSKIDSRKYLKKAYDRQTAFRSPTSETDQ